MRRWLCITSNSQATVSSFEWELSYVNLQVASYWPFTFSVRKKVKNWRDFVFFGVSSRRIQELAHIRVLCKIWFKWDLVQVMKVEPELLMLPYSQPKFSEIRTISIPKVAICVLFLWANQVSHISPKGITLSSYPISWFTT